MSRRLGWSIAFSGVCFALAVAVEKMLERVV